MPTGVKYASLPLLWCSVIVLFASKQTICFVHSLRKKKLEKEKVGLLFILPRSIIKLLEQPSE